MNIHLKRIIYVENNEIKTLYERIVHFLSVAESASTYAELRGRYTREGNSAEEVVSAKEEATKSWLAAKYLYCTNTEELDAYHKSSHGSKNTFEAMRKVVKNELDKEFERRILDGPEDS